MEEKARRQSRTEGTPEGRPPTSNPPSPEAGGGGKDDVSRNVCAHACRDLAWRCWVAPMLWLDDRGQSNKGGEVIGEGQIKEGDGTEAFTALSPSIDVAAAAAPAAEREVLIDRRAEATTAGEAAVVTVLANAAKGVPYPDAAAAVAMIHTSYVLVLFVEFGRRK